MRSKLELRFGSKAMLAVDIIHLMTLFSSSV